MNHGVVDAALNDAFPDFEDAVLHHSAVLAGADCIVTRNVADFRKSSIPVYSPAQFLAVLTKRDTPI